MVYLFWVLQKKSSIQKIITKSEYMEQFKQLNILKFIDLFYHNIALLMYDFDRGNLPKPLCKLFLYIDHSYQTRSNVKRKIKTPKIFSYKYGQTSFKFLGTKILNNLKEDPLFLEAKNKSFFKNNYKKNIINNY